MRTIAIAALLQLSSFAAAQTLASRTLPRPVHDRSHTGIHAFRSLALRTDRSTGNTLLMVFDTDNKNVMSTNGDRLTGPDIHELPSGTYKVYVLDLNGDYLAQERIVIGRP